MVEMTDKGRWIADTVNAMRRDGEPLHERTREVNQMLYGKPCCDGVEPCPMRRK